MKFITIKKASKTSFEKIHKYIKQVLCKVVDKALVCGIFDLLLRIFDKLF